MHAIAWKEVHLFGCDLINTHIANKKKGEKMSMNAITSAVTDVMGLVESRRTTNV